MRGERIGPAAVLRIKAGLTDEQRQVVATVADLRFATSGQVEAIHFPADGESAAAVRRRAQRTLQRLTDLRLLVRLQRRIGGARAGSAGFIYRLGPAGTRLLDLPSRFRRFEPSLQFLDHTLAVGQLVVDLTLADRRGDLKLLSVQTEPQSWRDIDGRRGLSSRLRPDLYVELAADGYEYRWFAEVDLGNEHVPTLVKKCRAYEAYYRSGREQAEHGVDPRVLWLMNDDTRAERLRAAVDRDRSLTSELFVVATLDRALDVAKGGQP